jgi:hypothetical protein
VERWLLHALDFDIENHDGLFVSDLSTIFKKGQRVSRASRIIGAMIEDPSNIFRDIPSVRFSSLTRLPMPKMQRASPIMKAWNPTDAVQSFRHYPKTVSLQMNNQNTKLYKSTTRVRASIIISNKAWYNA